MQRWVSIVLGAAVVALAVLLAYKSTPMPPAADAGAEASAPAPSASAPSALLGDAEAIPFLGLDASISLGDLALPDMSDGGARLPDKAPRGVRFGVVLVAFQGAQGASSAARSKADAQALAAKLAEDAKKDFHGAVQRGDSGSMDDAGRMPRGVLEPATEYALFTLPVGSVSDVIETPRGFWIVKRIE